MSQTIAILVDAYRELNARKMFWITLIISGVFMLAFAMLGATENTLSFATFEWPMKNARTVYKAILQVALVTIWLTWAAVILALISTASIFPDFMANGSIDLYLAKPIGRLRLFLTKYVSALLFVLLQATLFSVVAYFVVGFRAGEWKPSLFLAIPLITVFYSYLFSICALLGVWTRSAIASMLLTILVWFAIFGIHFAESFTLSSQMTAEAHADIQQQRIEDADARIAAEASRNPAATSPATQTGLSSTGDAIQSSRAPDVVETVDGSATSSGSSSETSLGTLKQSRERAVVDQKTQKESAATFKRWHTAFFVVMTVLPKTGETVGLLDRKLFEPDEMEKLMSGAAEQRAGRRARITDDEFMVNLDAHLEGSRRVQAEVLSRSPAWVIGTSLLFEVVILSIAAWIFCRRDY